MPASPRYSLTSLWGRIQDLIPRIYTHVSLKALPFILVLVTLVLGIIGGVQQSYDGTAKSFFVIVFQSASNLTLNFKNLTDRNAFIEASAFIGLVNIYLSAILIAANALRESRRKLFARWILRDHVLIIGDSELANRVTAIWAKRRARLLHVIPADGTDAPEWGSHSIRLRFDRKLAKAAALARARHVFLDLGTSITTLGLAYELVRALDSPTKHPVAQWTIVIRDVMLADHFVRKLAELRMDPSQIRAMPDVHFLDPDRLTARLQLASRPPFLIAQELRQRRVHVLLAGFSACCRSLLETVLLSSLTPNLERPIFTILCDQSEKRRQDFLAGRAALSKEIDFTFVEIDALDRFSDASSETGKVLRARDAADPVTTIFLACDTSEENIRLGFVIETLRRRLDRFHCPVFALEDDRINASFLTANSPFGQLLKDFSVFGLPDAILERQVCAQSAYDEFAKAIHARFAASKGESASAVRWEMLPESLRRANRAAVDHWRATMDILGFDVTAVPPGDIPRLMPADALMLEGLMAEFPSPTEGSPFWKAVRAEHDRWVLERKLDGWTFGETKDVYRETNPLLIDWEDLCRRYPDEAFQVAEQVKALISYLGSFGDETLPLRLKDAANAADVLPPYRAVTG